jgi:PKD repeat protein/uncharacterized protein YraI
MQLWNESSTAMRIIIVAALASVVCGLAMLCVLGLGLLGVVALPGMEPTVAPAATPAGDTTVPVAVVTVPVPLPTPAPGTPYVTASGTINIHSGPGANYPRIGIMAVGLSGEVVGVSPDRAWWAIKYPPGPNGQGWVAAQYVTPHDTENVPVIQPPPVPTPTAAPPVPITGWQGEYYDNRDLQGQPVLVRDDPRIDFDWGTGSPDTELPADNFSARWTISRDLPAGTYRFSIWVDDGVRMWVDNQLIIDDWREGGARNVAADLNLARGTHSARVEYFEATGAALIQLEAGYVDQYPNWKAEYFDNPNVQEPATVVRDEVDVNHNWGTGSPAPGVPDNNFSARWSRRISVPEEGNYLVRLDVAGGARLWLDGVLLIDDWTSQPLRALEAETGNITNGDHDLRIDYFKTTGNGQIRATASKLGTDGPPKAGINGATEAQVGQPVAFNARSSSVAPGSHIETFIWDFGDGTGASGVDAVHIYTTPGDYEVMLTVTDDKGRSDTTEHQITIIGAPVAPEGPKALITSPDQGIVGQPIVFDSSQSQSTHPIASSVWQFGDGTTANAVVVNKTYFAPGVYNVVLTLTDSQGLQGSTSKQITINGAEVGETPTAAAPTATLPQEATDTPVPEATDTPVPAVTDTPMPQVTDTPVPEDTPTPGQSVPPTPIISASVEGQLVAPGSPVTAQVGQTITFDGSPSQSGSSPIAGYGWDFGDGNTGTGATVNHAYSNQGGFQVTLTVTDQNGVSNTEILGVQIAAAQQ